MPTSSTNPAREPAHGAPLATAVRRALTIAGSDSGGGAGIQADLKVFEAFGVHGMTAIAALTAQNTLGVSGVHPVPPEFVRAQIKAVLTDIGADAAKTGMLYSAQIVEAVAESLAEFAPGLPLVIDPVAVAKGGDTLLRPDAVGKLMENLLPLSLLITPNADEAALLTGASSVETPAEAERAAARLIDSGARAVLLKGGHLRTAACDDYFLDSAGRSEWLRGERLDQRHTHGTGCSLSAAIAACLARDMELLDACRRAREYVAGAIRHARPLGSGTGPIHFGWERPIK